MILRPDIQSEIADKYVNVTEAIREAQSNRLNGLRRPKALFSGLIHCGVCGGPCSLRGQDRYACSARITNGSCANTRTITRSDLEQRVLCRAQGSDDGAANGGRGDARLRRGNEPAQPRTPRQRRRPPRGEIDATLHGELGTILGWIEAPAGEKTWKRETPAAFATGVSVSVVAGTGFEPVTFRL